MTTRYPYPSDVSDEERTFVAPFKGRSPWYLLTDEAIETKEAVMSLCCS